MVLTQDGLYELNVMLGDSKAEEYKPVPTAPSADAFVEANLFVKGVSYQKETEETDPFGEAFTQSWPVTPYKLRVVNNTDETRWVKLYVDGEEAFGTNVGPRAAKVLDGKQSVPGQNCSAVHELLFARPRLVRRNESVDGVDPAKILELQSIRLDVFDCTCTGESRGTKRGATGGFDGTNKAVCKKAKAGAMTRTGNELAPAANAGHKKWNYNISEKVASLRIRYAQRDKLGQYGVIAVEEE